ncbi:polysaccharide deacetylase family protein [Clostridium sp. SHJSY1]|uniref:polysaccharide deacetylase family protein n=1 Tax=Clostridium sp. SHJSY1 TaxID=2942483 RepID=UPI0028763CF4|nr:polysaccharide deacetylase family protein [Clostridium sp. SHJSY1]MDS0525879.1 polysaccharide deacetylase family protein [Clostridium sp. SHJSY1]
MKKLVKYKRRARYKKKSIVLYTSIIVFILLGGLITSLKFKVDYEKITAATGKKAEVIQAEQSKTDNPTSTENQLSEDSQSKSDDKVTENSQSETDTEEVKDNQTKTDDYTTKNNETKKDTKSTENVQSDLEENDSETKEKSSDQGDYPTLNKDPNADDVIELFNTTEKLIKGQLKYPVRKDGKKVVYLTFDDGPSTTNTPKVLDTLKANNVKATFFIMGKQIHSSKASSEILKRTVAEGHAIGNHTYSHDYKYLYPHNTVNVDNFMADVEKCDKELKSVLGENFSTRTIRFPGGFWSWKGRDNIRATLVSKNYGIIDWNTLSEDAEGKPNKTAEELTQITRKNLNLLGPNADSVVILMHDTYGKEQTAKSLQGIIDIFKEKGFEFRTMK